MQNPYQQDYSPNINPYQTPFRQFSNNLRPGQLTPLQLQQQQRFLQQQQNSGQYTPDNQFGFAGTSSLAGGTNFAAGTANQFANTVQSQGNFLPQQQNLTQQQQQNRQQQLNNQQQQNQNDQQQQQQQQLATQELRARPNQLVNTFGYNPYRRYKKSAAKILNREQHWSRTTNRLQFVHNFFFFFLNLKDSSSLTSGETCNILIIPVIAIKSLENIQ